MKKGLLILILIVCGVSFFPAASVRAQQTVFVPTCVGNATADTAKFTAIKTTIGTTNLATTRPPFKLDTTKRCKLNTFTSGNNITTDFTDGSVFVVTGQTLTLGPIVAPPGKQIFYNALSGQGTVKVTGTSYADWWGASPAGSAAANTAAIQAAISSLPTTGTAGGLVVISPHCKYTFSSLTIPNWIDIFDQSGYYAADDPTSNNGFTAGPRLYLHNDVTTAPQTNAGNEFAILSPYHPALILDNTGATHRSSLIFRHGGVSKWQVGNSIDGTSDDSLHITSYTIDPAGTTVITLDQNTGGMGLNAGAVDAGATLDFNSRTSSFIGLFQSHQDNQNVEFRYVRGPTDSSAFRMISQIAEASESSLRWTRGDTGATIFKLMRGATNYVLVNTDQMPSGLTNTNFFVNGGIAIANGLNFKSVNNAGTGQYHIISGNSADMIVLDGDGKTVLAGTANTPITTAAGKLRAIALDIGVQALSGAGAINLTTVSTAFTSTGGAQALTLADGTNGQIKTIAHVVDGGSGVLTPTTKRGYSTITFTNAGDSVTLQFFTTAGWIVIGSYGVTIAP